MKKILVVLVVAMLCFSLSAQTGLFAGGKLGLEVGINELSSDVSDIFSGSSYDEESFTVFGLGAYAGYMFSPGISVLAELNIYFDQGMEVETSGAKLNATYTSVDIPILLRYEFLQTPVILGIQVGPYLSFPSKVAFGGNVWDSMVSYYGIKSEYKPENSAIFGLTFGIIGGLTFGPGRLLGDIRFLTDLAPLEVDVYGETIEVFTRLGIVISLGYELFF
jgi:hypothetical protein